MVVNLDELALHIPENGIHELGGGYVVQPFGYDQICTVLHSPSIKFMLSKGSRNWGYIAYQGPYSDFEFTYLPARGVVDENSKGILAAMDDGRINVLSRSCHKEILRLYIRQERYMLLRDEQGLLVALANDDLTLSSKLNLVSAGPTFFYSSNERAEAIEQATEYIIERTGHLMIEPMALNQRDLEGIKEFVAKQIP